MRDVSDSTGPKERNARRNGEAAEFLPNLNVPAPLPPEPIGIAEMANLFSVTHRTLHFYEEKRLLTSRRAGLMRIYSHHDVQRMNLINTCREIGIPIAAIQDFMDRLDSVRSQADADDLFHELLATRKRELTADLSTIRRQVQQINDLLSPDDADMPASPDHAIDSTITLTDMERKCLELMAEGYAPIRLARALGLTSEELHKLEIGIIRKFGAHNRFQAVAKAVLLGIIPA